MNLKHSFCILDVVIKIFFLFVLRVYFRPEMQAGSFIASTFPSDKEDVDQSRYIDHYKSDGSSGVVNDFMYDIIDCCIILLALEIFM